MSALLGRTRGCAPTTNSLFSCNNEFIKIFLKHTTRWSKDHAPGKANASKAAVEVTPDGMGIPPEVGLEMALLMHQVTFQTRMVQV